MDGRLQGFDGKTRRNRSLQDDPGYLWVNIEIDDRRVNLCLGDVLGELFLDEL